MGGACLSFSPSPPSSALLSSLNWQFKSYFCIYFGHQCVCAIELTWGDCRKRSVEVEVEVLLLMFFVRLSNQRCCLLVCSFFCLISFPSLIGLVVDAHGTVAASSAAAAVLFAVYCYFFPANFCWLIWSRQRRWWWRFWGYAKLFVLLLMLWLSPLCTHWLWLRVEWLLQLRGGLSLFLLTGNLATFASATN